MHAFIFTMFIIAIKTGHSIPERLFGKESGRGAGARRSHGREEAGWGCWGGGLSPVLSRGDTAASPEQGGPGRVGPFCCPGCLEGARSIPRATGDAGGEPG